MFNNDYELKGKHATYIRFLSATTNRLDKTAKAAGIINTAVDIYAIAPLIGLAYNKKATEDNSSNDTYSILASQIINHQADLDFAFRLVMLADNSTELSSDEKIDRAFRQDEQPEKLAENLELFHQYMRGGIEWLYEHFTDGATTREDYLEKVYEVVNLYNEDFAISV
ncbi:hypothetical protein EDC14_105416 [Hydrogenispora ethanolica]|uniref:Uncharacterized protein n=1 Tax=Hydrogenispora ethanolica TaxID=1082276 RepID=A0A4R1QRW8_HYDET|nr:hypothetical protein [Hydrogenispora ethanolica]TCL55733.1 hypothetical protein EDC14_105416 [Hydrogenispora ethanolica]